MSEPFDLRPLSEDGHGSGAEARLGRDLHDLFPPKSEPLPDEIWAKLAPVAERQAARHARWHSLRSFLGSLSLRWVLVPATVAAAVLIVALVRLQVIRHSGPAAHLASAELKLTGSDASPRLATLESGVVLDVMGDVSVESRTSPGDHVVLRSGSVRATVPHLGPGRSFIVTTTDADVIVHGTRFTVRRSDAGTTVEVEQGLVEVRPLDGHRPASFVSPGNHLLVAPFGAYVANLATEVERAVDAEKCEGAGDLVSKYLQVASSPADMSAAIYLQGICAARSGQREQAIGYFEQVATIAPSFRADNALARAARLHEQEGRAAGTAAWNRYLERFPHGLHEELAHEFLADHGARAHP